MAPKLRIAVVGGGIGGLAATLALTRKGHEVRIFEQAPELRESGVGMHLGPNGSRLLERWGLGERLRAVGVRPTGMEVRDWSHGAPWCGSRWESCSSPTRTRPCGRPSPRRRSRSCSSAWPTSPEPEIPLMLTRYAADNDGP